VQANVNILDQLLPEAGAFYVMDRGYLGFERLSRFDKAGSFFVMRAKSNLRPDAGIRARLIVQPASSAIRPSS
jgi:hypothetical protein